VTFGYVDTSCLVAIAFDEPGASDVQRLLESRDRIFSSNLLEAELRAAFGREKVTWDPGFIARIGWVMPARRLSAEIAATLEAGYLRGADAWHVASALYLAKELGPLDFITLDDAQRVVAAKSGLVTP
jgi:uncharacterized protein with PIN domain